MINVYLKPVKESIAEINGRVLTLESIVTLLTVKLSDLEKKLSQAPKEAPKEESPAKKVKSKCRQKTL